MQRIFFKIVMKVKNTKLKDKSLHKPDTIVAEINRCLYKHFFFFQQPFLFAYFCCIYNVI